VAHRHISALARLDNSPKAAVWAERIDLRSVRIATVIGLSWVTPRDRDRIYVTPYDAHRWPRCPSSTRRQPSRIGHWRCRCVWPTAATTEPPSVSDLIVAATADFAGLTVLHVDKNFELIAEVTGQNLERHAI
jgi:predicted nucleic acid-binding protein